MKKWIITLSVFFLSAHLFSQTEVVPVFRSGDDGYKNFRIPAIVGLPNGEILAFCEGRTNGSADFGNIDIVFKRSTDKGKTWSAIQKIVDNDSLQAGNPAPVVDVTDPKYPKGRIFLFYNTGTKTESEVRKGNGVRQVWYITSADGGRTWSPATDITLQTHRPKQTNVNPAYNFAEDWRTYANTPGHALQFTEGKYKGRIYVAANHTAGNPLPRYGEGRAHGFYTDDHGKTFHLSEDVNVPGGNESTAAQLSGSGLVMNSRNQKGDVKARIVSFSHDGGQHWDTSYFDRNLPDPVNEGSILNIGKANGRAILAFSNAADTTGRNHLTLRISFDEGKSWKQNILVDSKEATPEKKNNDYAAYSDLVKIDDNTVGVYYERAGYTEIVFKAVKWR